MVCTIAVTEIRSGNQGSLKMENRNKSIICRYYEDLWNKWNVALADELLSSDVSFRGSLGVEVHGLDGFKGYVNMVRAAFPDFHNTIGELIAEDNKVVATLTYSGTHRGELFGIASTGRRVSYSGVAIFRLADNKILNGWVLGDTHSLIKQLRGV